jgi:DNA repair protein RadA/Sms
LAKSGRTAVRFVCRQCGFEVARWQGRCPGCEAWNSFDEEKAVGREEQPGGRRLARPQVAPVPITAVPADAEEMAGTGLPEVDRVLGGGIVAGSVVLIGGEPGVGKSTLLMQVAAGVAGRGRVLYVSGEESAPQIRARAARLGALHPRLEVLCDLDVRRILEAAGEGAPGAAAPEPPALLIVDSIQTMTWPDLPAAPGGAGQVRECAARLIDYAKTTGVPVFIVGHLTKDNVIAGPRTLEHMVDTVLYFEGDRQQIFRVLRPAKNRFGSTNETGIFEMTSTGLAAVPDPSAFFLRGATTEVPGSAVAAMVEGSRAFLVEVQALVAPTAFGLPRRTANGMDHSRLNLLLAVLERRAGLALGGQDVYVKVAGGLFIDEPALDLPICVAVASAFRNRRVIPLTAMAGEVGLAGEVRPVSRADQRAAEAAKMGFSRLILPAAKTPSAGARRGTLQTLTVSWIGEAIAAALEA